MRSTGIVRKVDELGRIVIPMELRRTIGIEDKDPLEIYVDGNKIILQPYQPGCTLCGSLDNLTNRGGKNICIVCLRDFIKQAKLDQATLKGQVE